MESLYPKKPVGIKCQPVLTRVTFFFFFPVSESFRTLTDGLCVQSPLNLFKTNRKILST